MKVLRLILCVGFVLGGFSPVNGQTTIDKVKNIFGTKTEPSLFDARWQQIRNLSRTPIFGGSEAEITISNYLSQELSGMMYKPYLGSYVHRFSIDKKNNLSEDSYIKIFNSNLEVGKEIIIPPFSGVGVLCAQALPEFNEPENLWFIKFSEVGVELNNKHGNGLEKLYRKAQEAFKQGAESVMFLNDDNTTSDFTNKFYEKKDILEKPVFILNHAAYKKYIVKQGKGKDWINVDYSFSKTNQHSEGHNVVGFWQNQTPNNIVIATRIDELRGVGKNPSGMAALLQVAQKIRTVRLKNYNYILVGISGTTDDWVGAEALMKKIRLTAQNTSAVIHIDDIGALDKKNELFISGVGTSPSWESVLFPFSKNFLLRSIASGEIGAANHRAFYNKQIPVINIFTKRKAGDTRQNKKGAISIINQIGNFIVELDKLPMLTFTKTKPLPDLKKLNFEVSMGVTPDYEFSGEGLLVGYVKKNSPAFNSNVAVGDVIVRMEEYDIRDVNDFVGQLAKRKKGDRMMIKVLRKGVPKKMLITFK